MAHSNFVLEQHFKCLQTNLKFVGLDVYIVKNQPYLQVLYSESKACFKLKQIKFLINLV